MLRTWVTNRQARQARQERRYKNYAGVTEYQTTEDTENTEEKEKAYKKNEYRRFFISFFYLCIFISKFNEIRSKIEIPLNLIQLNKATFLRIA
jgi:hypothetical protein